MSTVALDDFFSGRKESRDLFDIVQHMVESIGSAGLVVSKSQVAFRRRKNFVLVWIPGQYLHGKIAPLVLTFSLAHQDFSPRWKEVVKISPQRFTHHLELFSETDLDEQVSEWLRLAWESAA